MAEGQNQNKREETATEFQGGDVHLLETAINDEDGSEELDTNSEEVASTDDTDWEITSDNTAGTTTLENVNDIDFGDTGSFTVNQVVVQSTEDVDDLILDPDPEGDTDLSGDGDTTIPAGDLTYELGGE